MRADKKKHFLPGTALAVIAMIIALASEAAFILALMALDVLPGKYVAAVLIVIAILDVLMIWLLCGRSKKRKIPGYILALIILCVMGVGTYYMYDTYVTMEKISEYSEHWEDYDVVVAKDGTYDSAADIKGQKVYAYDNSSKMYQEAREKLITKSDVEFDYKDDVNAVCDKLVNSDGVVSDKIIYISDNNYQMMCEEDKNFKKNTKVLFTIKVAQRENDNKDSIDVTQDPFNICVSGIDMWGDIDQVSRSDVNMIITVNPQTHTILLSSVPRDSYVTLHTYQELDKLTHSGIYGVDETVKTLEDWLDIDIQYYIRVDFSMLVDIVNAIGGIDVYSDYEFDSSIHNCDHHDTHYEKGWNHMNGKEALYFARERHAFEDEDQQRIIDQQKVMKACLKKVMSSNKLLTNYTDLLKAVDGEMQTDISQKDMAALVKMQLKDMPEWDIQMQTVKGDLTMKGTYSMGFGRDLLVSIPREESVKEVSQKIHDVLYPDSTKGDDE